MKKLLGIVVLSLLLTGCFNKKETALENCADDKYANFSEDSMTSVFYDRKNTRIIGLSESLEKAKIKQNEANDKHTKYVKKNYSFDGAKLNIIYDKNIITSPEELENYKDTINTESLKLLKDSTYWYGEVGYLNKTLNNEKLYSASKIFWEAPLKRKIDVNEYYKSFTECEKEHTEAPDAFVLRWKD